MEESEEKQDKRISQLKKEVWKKCWNIPDLEEADNETEPIFVMKTK